MQDATLHVLIVKSFKLKEVQSALMSLLNLNESCQHSDEVKIFQTYGAW